MFRCVTTEIHLSCFSKSCRRLTHPTGLLTFELVIVPLSSRQFLTATNPQHFW